MSCSLCSIKPLFSLFVAFGTLGAKGVFLGLMFYRVRVIDDCLMDCKEGELWAADSLYYALVDLLPEDAEDGRPIKFD